MLGSLLIYFLDTCSCSSEHGVFRGLLGSVAPLLRPHTTLRTAPHLAVDSNLTAGQQGAGQTFVSLGTGGSSGPVTSGSSFSAAEVNTLQREKSR